MMVGRFKMVLGGALGLALVLGQSTLIWEPHSKAGDSSHTDEIDASQWRQTSATISVDLVTQATVALEASPQAVVAASVSRRYHASGNARGATYTGGFNSNAKFEIAPDEQGSATESLEAEAEAEASAGVTRGVSTGTQTSAAFVHPLLAIARPSKTVKSVAPPPAMVVPLRKYRISAVFRQAGPHTGGVHGGLDFAAPEGRKIVSICEGKVIEAKWMGNAGQSVIVRMKNGKDVLYGHMSQITTKKGARVQPGDELGRVGTTGNSTGPHLHLQVTRPNGKVIDPLKTLEMSLAEVERRGRR